jgi:hypothetical protein
MRAVPTSKRRFLLMGMLAAFAVLGLTSCDGEADHYYVFFGPITPADPGPSCTSWCVKTEAFNTGGSFHVHKGQKVRFVKTGYRSGDIRKVFSDGRRLEEDQDHSTNGRQSDDHRGHVQGWNRTHSRRTAHDRPSVIVRMQPIGGEP